MSERVGVSRTPRTSANNWHAREELQPEQPMLSCNVVLVEKGRAIGIITRHDVIEKS